MAGNERQWTKDVFWKAINHLKSAHDIYKNFTIEEQEKNRSTYADICALHGRTLVGSSKYIELAINYLECSLSLKEDLDVRYQLAKAYYFKKDYIYQRLSNNFLLLNNMDEALKYAQLVLIYGKRNYKNIFCVDKYAIKKRCIENLTIICKKHEYKNKKIII